MEAVMKVEVKVVVKKVVMRRRCKPVDDEALSQSRFPAEEPLQFCLFTLLLRVLCTVQAHAVPFPARAEDEDNEAGPAGDARSRGLFPSRD